jgi:nicotinamidase-related amidase
MTSIALMMIDFQRDFCRQGGYVDRFAGIDWVRPILGPAQRLLEAARRAGHLVVHTREGYAPDLSDCSRSSCTAAGRPASRSARRASSADC